MRQKLAKMTPIIVPSSSYVETKLMEEKKDVSKEDVATIDDLSKRLSGLRNKINKTLTSASVVDLNQTPHPTGQPQEIPAFVPTTKVPQRKLIEKELSLETESLKLEIARMIAGRKPGGQISADFAQFPTPLMARAMAEKDCTMVGRVRLASKPVKTVPLILGPQELRNIHQSVLA